MQKYLFLPFLFSVILLSYLTANGQSVEEILKKYIDTIELNGRIDSVHSIRIKGVKYYNGIKSEFTDYRERPYSYQFQSIDEANNVNIICCNGNQQWLCRNDNSPMRLSDTPLGKYNNIDEVFKVHIFNTLVEHWLAKDTFELQGKETIDGEECYVIKENWINSFALYYINVVNYTLVMRKVQSSNSNTETYQYLKNYKNIQGLLLPSEELVISYVNGRLHSTQKQEYTEIQLNYKMIVDCPPKRKVIIKE